MKILFGALLVLFLIFAFLPSPASALDPWTKTDTAFQAATVALTLADWGQTRWMQRQYTKREPGRIYWEGWRPEGIYDEINPILGEHPSQSRIDVYFAGLILGHTAIARLLPNPYRRIWQGVFIVTEAGFVAHNITIGARIKF